MRLDNDGERVGWLGQFPPLRAKIEQFDEGELEFHPATPQLLAEPIGPPMCLFITPHNQGRDTPLGQIKEAVVAGKHPQRKITFALILNFHVGARP